MFTVTVNLFKVAKTKFLSAPLHWGLGRNLRDKQNQKQLHGQIQENYI